MTSPESENAAAPNAELRRYFSDINLKLAYPELSWSALSMLIANGLSEPVAQWHIENSTHVANELDDIDMRRMYEEFRMLPLTALHSSVELLYTSAPAIERWYQNVLMVTLDGELHDERCLDWGEGDDCFFSDHCPWNVAAKLLTQDALSQNFDDLSYLVNGPVRQSHTVLRKLGVAARFKLIDGHTASEVEVEYKRAYARKYPETIS